MFIRLTVLGQQGSTPAQSSITFDASGGTIGRSMDCDWTLPDPDGLLSRQHARIFLDNGVFRIRDDSTNGVFLNDASTPLGPGRTAILHDGDHISIGNFILVVAISDTPFDDASAVDVRGSPPDDEQTPITPPWSVDPFKSPPSAEPFEAPDDWFGEDGLPDLLPDSGMEPPAEEAAVGTAEPVSPPSPARPAPVMGGAGPDRKPAAPPEPPGAARVPTGYVPFADAWSDDGEYIGVHAEEAMPAVPAEPRPKRIDTVDFAVFGPPALVPGQRQIIDVWAYPAGDFAAVKALAAEVHRDQAFGRKAGLPVWREAIIQLTLSMPEVEVLIAGDTVRWQGDPTNASFIVALPADLTTTELLGTVGLSIDGVPLGRITFVAPLEGTKTERRAGYEREFVRIRKAFASYASDERAEVLSRLQGMRAISPDLDIFLDVLSLRAGDNWEARLRAEVPTRDAFYLFWSQKAAASLWVTREWQLALAERGLDYIVPVPLQDPRDAPPPDELSRLHFNDAFLDHIAYLRLRQQSGGTPRSGPPV